MSWQEELNEKRLKTRGWYGCIAPNGWKWIIEDLDAQLAYLDPKYEIQQVKEKFGTLRYYYETSKKKQIVRDIMDAVVRVAERQSATTCEVCGNSSSCSIPSKGVKYDSTAKLKVRNGWYKTICDSCDVDGAFIPGVDEYDQGFEDGQSAKEDLLIANVNALINSVIDYGIAEKYDRVVANLTTVIRAKAK